MVAGKNARKRRENLSVRRESSAPSALRFFFTVSLAA
jgi:hypothetical protein